MLWEKIADIKQFIRDGCQDPGIRDLATKILTRKMDGWAIKPLDAEMEAKQLFLWVKRNIRFVGDPPFWDRIPNAPKVLRDQGADCVGLSVLLGSLLCSVGFEVRVKIISREGKGYDHVLLLVPIPPRHPRRFMPLDATMEGPGLQPRSRLSPIIVRV